jgi:hypothetical protein
LYFSFHAIIWQIGIASVQTKSTEMQDEFIPEFLGEITLVYLTSLFTGMNKSSKYAFQEQYQSNPLATLLV